MVVIGFAEVWLLLSGSSSFNAFGATKVDVIMKKMSNKNTRSDIDAMLNSVLILLFRFNAIYVDYTGSFNRSINSEVVTSILKTTDSTLVTRIL